MCCEVNSSSSGSIKKLRWAKEGQDVFRGVKSSKSHYIDHFVQQNAYLGTTHVW